MTSSELKKKMQEAGVLATPDVQYVEDARAVHRTGRGLAPTMHTAVKFLAGTLDNGLGFAFQATDRSGAILEGAAGGLNCLKNQ